MAIGGGVCVGLWASAYWSEMPPLGLLNQMVDDDDEEDDEE